MKLEAVFNKIEAHRAKVEQTRKEIEILNARLKEAQANAEDLANQGDEEGYLAIMREIRELQDRIYVKNKIVNSDAPVVSEEEAKAVWNEHAAEYGRAFEQKYAKFEKARKQFCDMYADMLEDQRQILQDRARIDQAIKHDANTYSTPDTRFPFRHIPVPGTKIVGSFEMQPPRISCYGLQFADFVTPLFYASNDIDQETAQAWTAIVNGSDEIPPMKVYRPKLEQHIDKFGLFIGR